MHNCGLRYQWVETAQAKVRCTYKKRTLSVSGFRCWQLQVPLRGHWDGSGRAWEPVTLQCTPIWSCSAAIPLFLAGTGYKVLFPCFTASLKKLSPGSFFQLDNNGTFMECFQRFEVLYNLIKEIVECINTHTENQTWWHNNAVIKWWTYLFTQSNMKHIYICLITGSYVCAHTCMQAHMYMHTHACACTLMHAPTQNLLQSETGKFITKFNAVIPGSICYELHLDRLTSSIGKQKANKATQKEKKTAEVFWMRNAADQSARKNTCCWAMETTKTAVFRNSLFFSSTDNGEWCHPVDSNHCIHVDALMISVHTQTRNACGLLKIRTVGMEIWGLLRF